MNFKEIHIGTLIKQAVTESGIEMSRICNFFKYNQEEIEKMYQAKSLETDIVIMVLSSLFRTQKKMKKSISE